MPEQGLPIAPMGTGGPVGLPRAPIRGDAGTKLVHAVSGLIPECPAGLDPRALPSPLQEPRDVPHGNPLT
jgi:hypothetical protein